MEHLDGVVVEAAGGAHQGTQAQDQCHAPSSSSLPDSLNLMLLSAGHSTGNLFEILPGYVAFCSVEQHIWDPLVVWECHWLMCFFFFLLPVNLSALMLSSCPFTEW